MIEDLQQIKTTNMTKYKFFWNGPFSNWHPANFTYKGIDFANSEQAFMWEKAMFFGDKETADEMLKTTNPGEVKRLGRIVSGYDDNAWANVRYKFMLDVCVQKFSQNEDLKSELLKNDNYVEASPYDKIWGIGMMEGDNGIEDPKNWKGLNLLGKVLDEVKTLLR